MKSNSQPEKGSEEPAGNHGVNGFLVLLAGITLLLLGATSIWGFLTIKNVLAEKTELKGQWSTRIAGHTRLSMVRERMERVEEARDELAGSWRRETDLGQILTQAVNQFPESIPIGKITLESDYMVEERRGRSLQATPVFTQEVMLAARCFAQPADAAILDLIDRLQTDTTLGPRLEAVGLQGVQKIERQDDPARNHTVFALNLALSPRHLNRRPETQ